MHSALAVGCIGWHTSGALHCYAFALALQGPRSAEGVGVAHKGITSPAAFTMTSAQLSHTWLLSSQSQRH